MRFATPQGFNACEQFFGYLKDSFDLLYGEGRAGQPKMLSVGLHCRLVGRPGRAAALARFLDYVMSHDGVWPARRIDRSEEHTSEIQSLRRTSYDVCCSKTNNNRQLTDKHKTTREVIV